MSSADSTSHCRQRSVELEQQVEAAQGEAAKALARLEQQAAEHEAAQAAAAARITGAGWLGGAGICACGQHFTWACAWASLCSCVNSVSAAHRPCCRACLPAAALAAAAELQTELESRAGRVRELQQAQEKLQVGGCRASLQAHAHSQC